MVILTPEIEALIPKIIACAIAVHHAFGPGLLESIYRDCLLMELKAAGFAVRSEQYVPLMFRGERVSADLKLDLILENTVIIEVKAVERLHTVHLAQLITYLKLAEKPIGMLFNFNTPSLRAGGIRRVTHPCVYGKTRIFHE